MADIAALGLAVDSRQVTRGAGELDRLSGASWRAEAAATGMGASAQNAGRRIVAANDNAARSTTLLGRAFHGARGQLIAFGAAVAGALSARAVLTAADAYTQFRNSLRVAGVEGSRLAEVEDRLFDAANRNGVEIGALSQLYSRASIAAAELGTSEAELLQFVDGVTAALRVQGGSAASSSGALLQLSQALGSGIVRAEEFNSILEGAFPIAQAAARGIEGMGGSVARLRTAIINGEITSQVFFQGLLKGFTATEALAAGMSLTVGGAMTALRNSFTRFVGVIDQTFGASGSLSAGIAAVGLALDSLATHLDVIIKISKVVGAAILVAFGPTMVIMIGRLTVAIATGLVGAIRAVGVAIAANPLGALLVAITTIITAAYVFRDDIKRIFGIDVVEAAKIGANAIIGPLVGAYEFVRSVWSNLPDALSGFAKMAANRILDAFGSIRNDIRERIGLGPIEMETRLVLTDAEGKAIGAATGSFGDALGRDYIGNLFHDLAAGGSSAADSIERINEAARQTPPALGALSKEAQKAADAYAKIVRNAEQFIAEQELERRAYGMTEEAANRLRYEQELLNKAANDNIKLTPTQRAELEALAASMAGAEAATNRYIDAMEFTKETFKGFVSDFRQGMKDGEGIWASFATAAQNALDKIVDKLLNDVIDAIFQVNSAASSGGGGGLFGWIGQLFGVGLSSGASALTGAGLFHGGGVVGKTAVPQVAVHPSLFANAPRLHGGLMPDEFPAILQRGEEVRSRAQVANDNRNTYYISVDARGAAPGVGAEVEQAIRRAIADNNRFKIPRIIADHKGNSMIETGKAA